MAWVKTPYDEYEEVGKSILDFASSYNLPRDLEELEYITNILAANFRFLNYLEKCCDEQNKQIKGL